MIYCIYIEGSQVKISKKYCISLAVFVLANSAGPDEKRHFHMGLHCLQKYGFMGLQSANLRVKP